MKTSVLVVDDSAFMRKALKRIIESDEQFEVIGVARDGNEALELIPQLKPTVVTLDVEMPHKNGLETLRELRAQGVKTPVIVVSSITRFGSDMAIRCLEAGAFDIVRKPESYVSMDIHQISGDLVSKLKAATRTRHPRFGDFGRRQERTPEPGGFPTMAPFQKAKERTTRAHPEPETDHHHHKRQAHARSSLFGQRVITIGSSTGGPVALQRVLTALPDDLPSAIVMVQHMPPGDFIFSLADRLRAHSPFDVRVAKDSEILSDGVVRIGPIGKHIIFERVGQTYRLRLVSTPRDMLHCPSIDVLFESAGQVIGSRNISCILTGMGSDGTHGLSFVHKNKGYIIAEAEETCVVYGMPRSAVEAGYVNEIAPLTRIPQILQSLIF